MTRPTQEQIDGLKAGDRVLVEATVVLPEGSDRHLLVEIEDARRAVSVERRFCPNLSAIHSILPREIKVGDRVNTPGCPDDKDPGVVVHIADNHAWVDWARLGHSVSPLSGLRVIP